MTGTVQIESVGHRGDGIACLGGEPIFVPFTLPGETVEIDIAGERGSLTRIASASPDRVEPFCPHFGLCGGCSLQHWGEPAYRAWKRSLVETALRQRGISADVAELVDAHGAGRRRATFHARLSGGRLQSGFMAARSHEIVDLDRCPVLCPELAEAPRIARELARPLARKQKLDVTLTGTETGIDCAIRGVASLSLDKSAALAEVAHRHGLARLTVDGELVVQTRPPVVTLGRAQVELPPGAFLQSTLAGEEALWALVRRGMATARRAADLFCGIGPFALRLAERATVVAVDSDRPAIDALSRGARSAQGLKPIETSVRDLFRDPLRASELASFEAVVLDPPRQGAKAQARELAKSAVPTVVAVSCEPATLARDAAILLLGGYRLATVTPVDQFKWTAHVECVAVFVRS